MKKDTSPSPNPTIAMSWFFVITTFYFVIRSFTIKVPEKGSGMSRILFSIYIFSLIVGELIINIGLTKAMCKDSAQYGTAIIATVVPYVVIFGTMNILLQIFPGWLRPFSNTFGFIYTKGAVSATINELFDLKNLKNNKSGNHSQSTQNNKVFMKTLENLYNDKSLLVNEITTDNFDTFMANMAPKAQPVLRNELLNHITTKESIAEYIWYLLTGGLVTSASFNYIVNAGCSYSIPELQQRDKDYLKVVEKNEKEKKNATKEADKYKSYE